MCSTGPLHGTNGRIGAEVVVVTATVGRGAAGRLVVVAGRAAAPVLHPLASSVATRTATRARVDIRGLITGRDTPGAAQSFGSSSGIPRNLTVMRSGIRANGNQIAPSGVEYGSVRAPARARTHTMRSNRSVRWWVTTLLCMSLLVGACSGGGSKAIPGTAQARRSRRCAWRVRDGPVRGDAHGGSPGRGHRRLGRGDRRRKARRSRDLRRRGSAAPVQA